MNNKYMKCVILFASALIFDMNHFVMAAQHCNTTIPATIADGQLVENGDGTVTDTKTGLMWKQQSEKNNEFDDHAGVFSWVSAINRAASSSYAGHTDWRVPNTKELLSLVEWRCAFPAINLQYFPELGDGWSELDRTYDAVDITINKVSDDDNRFTPHNASMARVSFDSGSVSPGLSYYYNHLRLVRDAN